MFKKSFSNIRFILLIGDIIVLGLVTGLGIFQHASQSNFSERFGVTWLPWVLIWLVIGISFGLFKDYNNNPLWVDFARLSAAMAVTSIIAGYIRSFWLNTQLVPIFVLVFGSLSLISIFSWRWIYYLTKKRVPLSG